MERTCEIRLVDFGSLKALVSVTIGAMEIRGFKVIDQGDGKPWVAPPSREILRDGRKEYFNIVRFQDDEAKKEFRDFVLDAYERERKLTSAPPLPGGRPHGSSPGGSEGARTGRYGHEGKEDSMKNLTEENLTTCSLEGCHCNIERKGDPPMKHLESDRGNSYVEKRLLHLFVASPKLLAALKAELEKRCGKGQECEVCGGDGTSPPYHRDCCRETRAAIAKAEGRKP